MRALGWRWIAAAALVFGCSGTSGEEVCSTGEQRACSCEWDPKVEGTQSCGENERWGACAGCPVERPCEGVDCGQHGECVGVEGYPTCQCDAGFKAVDLSCVPDVCEPDCGNAECGDDGCGGLCGSCDPGYGCVEGGCVCQPDCTGKHCGPDGCGGTCGSCLEGFVCVAGQCGTCVPDCDGKECGDDGCGGTCGSCVDKTCVDGVCSGCLPNCDERTCGDDGCAGSCGTCPAGSVCTNGQCVSCQPQCAGKDCGDNGCGGVCGTCPVGKNCVQGVCMKQPTGVCVGYCGDSPPGMDCYCDDQCFMNDDCCPNVCDSCPMLPACGGEACQDEYSLDCYYGCSPSKWLGDGVCNSEFDCYQWDWDLLDCTGTVCQDGEIDSCWWGECVPSVWLGDGTCQEELNCSWTGWDNGDCFVTCGDDEIADCWNWCTPKSWLGNGVCDYGLECEQWNWDEGDCQAPSDSCKGFCGVSAGLCYCDSTCFTAGDCCADVCDHCFLVGCGCVPDCTGKQCGNDGCYGSCGWCDWGSGCNETGQCIVGLCQEGYIKDCDGQCGWAGSVGDGYCDDGSGYDPWDPDPYPWDGEEDSDVYWGNNFNCEEFDFDGGDCEPCIPKCDGKVCGYDGCWGVCGECSLDEVCFIGQCGQPVACGKIMSCAFACLELDDPEYCVEECWSAGTPQAQMLAENVFECLEDTGIEGCSPTDQICIDQAIALCSVPWDVCQADM